MRPLVTILLLVKYFVLQTVKVKVLVAQPCPTLCPQNIQPTRLLYPWNSLGKNTSMDSHSLQQGIFPTQGSNSGLLDFRQILYHLSHQGSPPIDYGLIFNNFKLPIASSIKGSLCVYLKKEGSHLIQERFSSLCHRNLLSLAQPETVQ